MSAELTFGHWLKRRRQGLGFTQKELAQRIGYAEVSVRKVEADERLPSREMAEKLAEQLEIASEAREQFIRYARGEPGQDEFTLSTQTIGVADLPAPGAGRESASSSAPPPPPPRFLDPDAEAMGPESMVFVGREQKLVQLNRFLETALTGRGQVAFVTGEAGSGKSTLMRAFVRHALQRHAHLIVASGACHVYTGVGDPYLPFREVLCMLSGDVETQWAAGAITRDQALRTWQLLPHTIDMLVAHGPDLLGTLVSRRALAARAAAHTSPQTTWREQLQDLLSHTGRQMPDQSRLFAQVARVLQALAAHQPLLLVLDDLHWADVSSISLIFHLARSIGESRIVIVGAYRPEEVATAWPDGPHPLDSVVSEIKRRFGRIQVDLDQENTTESRRFVSALLDLEPNRLDSTFRQALLRHGRGHPLFTVELLRDLQDREVLVRDGRGRWIASQDLVWNSLPARVEGVIEKRIRRLDAESRAILSVACVVGETFSGEVVARVLDMDAHQVVRWLSGDLQKKHRLVRVEGMQTLGNRRLSLYRFGHNLFQHYLYQSLDAVERTHLHEAVGTALERMHQGQEDFAAIAGTLARHFEEAGLVTRAVSYLAQAAGRTHAIFALAEAEHFYSRALQLAQAHPEQVDESQRLALHQGRGEIRGLMGGRTADAVADLEVVLSAARRQGDGVKERSLLIHLGQVYRLADQLDQAIRYLAAAMEAARAAQDLASLADTLYHLGTVAWSAGDNHQAMRHHQEAVEICEQLNSQDLLAVQAFHGLGEAYISASHPDAAIQHFTRSLDLARGIGDRRYETENLQMLCYCQLGLVGNAQYEFAQQTGWEAVEIARDTHVDWHKWLTTTFLAHALACRGDYQQAYALTQQAVTALEASRMLRFLSMAYDFQGYLFQDLNLHEQALAAHEAGLQTGLKANVGFWLPRLLADVAIDRLRLGDLAVQDELTAPLTMSLERNQLHHAIRALEGLAELFIARHEVDHARVYSRQLLDLAVAGNMQEMEAVAYRWQAEAYLHEHDYDAAQRLLQRSLRLADAIGRVRLLWTVHERLELLYTRWARPAEASTHRRQKEAQIRQIAANLQEPNLRAALPAIS